MIGEECSLSRGEPSLWRHAAHRCLDGVERSDLPHGGFGDRRLGVARQLHKASAQMAPAMDERPRSLRSIEARQPVIAVIGVALQEPSAEALQEVFGMLAAATRRIAEQHDRRALAAMAAIVGGDRPEEAFLDLAAPGIEHRRRGFVHEQTIRRSQMPAHVTGDGLEMEAGPAGPIAQCRPIQLDALASIDLGLPVERQMVAELGDDHLRDQRLGRQAARHHMLGRMGLHHRARAATASVFRAARDQHAPLRRDHVQPFAHVLADLRHLAATARAQRAFGLDDPLHPRQMGRQVAAIAPARTGRAVRTALDNPLGFFLRGIEHALRDLHVFERQVVLIGMQLLGLGAELLAVAVGRRWSPGDGALLRMRPKRLAPRRKAPSGARSLPGEPQYSCAKSST